MPHRPIMLGVVGDSAAGKTTLSAGIASSLGDERVTVICSDDYHRYNREQRKSLSFTALHPDCNYIDVLEQHLHLLGDGAPILKPVYNHSTGDFDAPVYVKPKQFVIVEGLLGFHTAAMRDCFHVKVYLDPPEELRRSWKIKRDCTKRGYSAAQVLAEMAKREAESAEFIRVQKRWADVVVRFYPPEGGAEPERLNVELTLRQTLAQPDLSDVILHSAEGASAMRLIVGRDAGRLAEFLRIDGCVRGEQAAAIEDAIWSQEPELRQLLPRELGTFVDGREERRSHPLALSQLIIAYHLLLGRLAKERKLREGLGAQAMAAVEEPRMVT
jgi:phosphoribulokinase